MSDQELYHFGILGQKWGIRRFQNEDGTWTEAGKKRRNMSGGEKIASKLESTKKQIRSAESELLEAKAKTKEYKTIQKAKQRAFSEAKGEEIRLKSDLKRYKRGSKPLAAQMAINTGSYFVTNFVALSIGDIVRYSAIGGKWDRQSVARMLERNFYKSSLLALGFGPASAISDRKFYNKKNIEN